MNSDDVMRQLKHLANLETMVVTSPHLEAENGELVYRRGQLEYKVGRDALHSAASMSHIPEAYAKKCPADLLVTHINYWMEKIRKCRLVTRDSEVVAFVESDSVPMSPERALDTVAKVMPEAGFERLYERNDNVGVSSHVACRRNNFLPFAKFDTQNYHCEKSGTKADEKASN